MATDKLRLEAELIDKVSQPARRMAQSFEALKRASARDLPDAFRKYQQAVAANEKALANYGKRTLSIGRELQAFQGIVRRVAPAVGGLTDELSAFSVGAGAAVGVVAAVGAGLVIAGKNAAKFAADMRQLRFASQETGFSITQLKQLQLVGTQFGISAEQMATDLDAFSESMLQAHRNAGAFQTQLAEALGPGGLRYASNLLTMAKHGASAADELKELAKVLDQIKRDHPGPEGERLAGMFAGFFTHDRAFGRMGGADLKEKLAQVKEFGFSPEELAAADKEAEKLNKTLFEIELTFDRWNVKLENGIIRQLNEIIEQAKKLRDLNVPGAAETFGGGPQSFGGGAKSFGGGGGGAKSFGGGGGGRGPGMIGPGLLPGLGGGGGGGGPGITIPGGGGGGEAPPSTPGGTGGVGGGGLSPTPGGSGGAFDRSWAAAEIAANPGLMNRWIATAANEDYPSTPEGRRAFKMVLEESANRARHRGTSLAHESRWTSEGGYYEGRPHWQILQDPKNLAAARQIAAEVLAGSDTSGGATDNSSQGLAARERASGKFRFHTSAHGESFFSPGWGEPGLARSWPGWYQRELHQGAMARLNLNQALSGMPNKVDTSGEMSVNVNAPSGTTVRTGGALFRRQRLQRNVQMPDTNTPTPQQGGW